MPTPPPADPDRLLTDALLKRLWMLLDEATTMATSARALDRMSEVAALCDGAAIVARAAALVRSS